MEVQTQEIHIALPVGLYQRVKSAASNSQWKIEKIICEALNAYLPPLPEEDESMHVKIEAEESLEELVDATDGQLQALSESTMPEAQQQHLSQLLHRNQAGTILAEERQQLDELLVAYQQGTLMKAKAIYTLTKRQECSKQRSK